MSAELQIPTDIESRPWIRVVEIDSWRMDDDKLREIIVGASIDWASSPLVIFTPENKKRPSNAALRGFVQICSSDEAEVTGVSEISNELSIEPKGNGKFQEIKRPDQYWHSENTTYTRVAGRIALSASQVPNSGSFTDFFNAASLYSGLGNEKKEFLSDIFATYRFGHAVLEEYPNNLLVRKHYNDGSMNVRPLVVLDPITGLKSIFFAEPHFVGADRFGEDVTDQVRALANAPDERPDLCYRHSWEGSEILVWSNLAFWHRAVASDGIRSVITARTLLPEDFINR